MNKKPTKDVLSELMQQKGIKTEAELSRLTGIHQPTIHRILTGESTDPRSSTIEPLARFFNVQPEVIRGTAVLTAEEKQPTYIAQQVPVVSWVTAGHFADSNDPYPVGASEEWLPCPVPHGRMTFALRVRGISMEPEFRDGDYIFVDPDVTPRNRSYVVVRIDDRDETTFKQLILEDGRKLLKPLNPAWPEQIIEINGKGRICGVVVFSGRKP